SVNTAALQSGVYFFQLKNSKTVLVEKFVKQ
ncbi:MAG: T9SS type A sorting domain-containing protein, partial [Saprospiraceae bacterium]